MLSLSSRVYASVSSTQLVIPRFVGAIVKRRAIYDQPVGVYHRNSLPRMVLVSRTRRHLERRPSTRQSSSYPFHHLYFRIVSDSRHSFFSARNPGTFLQVCGTNYLPKFRRCPSFLIFALVVYL
jgi:hypothetical protein